ncbi:PREDICTED: zinc finger matrin-type protein 2-like [Amphimedon queenslandica]|uniref:U1-type domain-containing protein n=1 Tax=Amphimedon queenslandica TaxID=400682 RepID=A0A1X7UDM7_AMPQE|nr:PREDICTED: zinc finger matrin-type protein 2-like [Amphimedon queenslandica]|eukprot:XP_003388316.1 PREDICTED: zinc finger matrin-type protein 2-like [Amphimedon queenslandica]
MASGSNPVGVSDGFRRTWDRSLYEGLAKERLKKDSKGKDDKDDKPQERELLKHRDYKIDLDGKLGKSLVITQATPQSQSGGYYCNVCDCVIKDSINFLDHINGRKHQKNMGMSMKVEKSTLDQVKRRFAVAQEKKQEEKKQYDFDERMKELHEEEEKLKEYRREKRKERKRKGKPEEEEEEVPPDPELELMMGFSGFGTKKKK